MVIDDVQGITSPSPTPTPTITPTPSPTPPTPLPTPIPTHTSIILTYHDFNFEPTTDVCIYGGTGGKAVVYGSMTTDINVSEGASELKVTISICCNGEGEGLKGPAGSAACIHVDGERKDERIDSTMPRYGDYYFKYKHCDSFSNTFNVSGKEKITLTIEMSGGALLDFDQAELTFS